MAESRSVWYRGRAPDSASLRAANGQNCEEACAPPNREPGCNARTKALLCNREHVSGVLVFSVTRSEFIFLFVAVRGWLFMSGLPFQGRLAPGNLRQFRETAGGFTRMEDEPDDLEQQLPRPVKKPQAAFIHPSQMPATPPDGAPAAAKRSFLSKEPIFTQSQGRMAQILRDKAINESSIKRARTPPSLISLTVRAALLTASPMHRLARRSGRPALRA